MDQNAQELVVDRYFTFNSTGRVWGGGADLSAGYPQGGGLVQVDDEIMAYSAVAAGRFTITQNGRGLLNTEPRGHDRGDGDERAAGATPTHTVRRGGSATSRIPSSHGGCIGVKPRGISGRAGPARRGRSHASGSR